MLGGIVSDSIGIRQIFLYTALINILAALVFGTVILLNKKRNKNASTAGYTG